MSLDDNDLSEDAIARLLAQFDAVHSTSDAVHSTSDDPPSDRSAKETT